MKQIFILTFFIFSFITFKLAAEDCIDCHIKITPNIVTDWQLSKHSSNSVDCEMCHGGEHNSAEDVNRVLMPNHETCYDCHEAQVSQFLKGKHSIAWAAVKAMPTTHMLPTPLDDGMKGCGGCHKMGVKSEEELERLKAEGSIFGNASCDACHTRHTFSLDEARQPEACQTCHMGFDHPQWEMYSSSKHGVRYGLIQKGILPERTAAPRCQTCHMIGGNHEVRTAWGFLAVKLPLSEDPEWAADQVTILQALGVLDMEGKPTEMVDIIKAADVARLTTEAWETERSKILSVCSDCHSENFAKGELEKGDQMIREADKLMAEAIREVASLYNDGVLEKPENYSYAFPMLLTFQDAPTVIEQDLFEMFLKHRMRTFQGIFHANPDYAFWYGWSEMVRDVSRIREQAQQMRRDHQ